MTNAIIRLKQWKKVDRRKWINDASGYRIEVYAQKFFGVKSYIVAIKSRTLSFVGSFGYLNLRDALDKAKELRLVYSK